MHQNYLKVTPDPHIFREYDIRGVTGTQLTRESVSAVGRGIAEYFRRNSVTTIAVGRDARASSPWMRDALVEALVGSGVAVVDIGMVPTPVLYYAVHTSEVDGAVMITGSHNPPDHNGFKICLGKHTLFGDEIQEIKDLAIESAGSEAAGSVPRKSDEKRNVIEAYVADLSSRISLGERKLKVVVDSGNGMGGVTAIPLYRELGVEVVELFTEPDGSFPNHEADPSVEANLAVLIEAVRNHHADVGIAFDGDGDRLGVVDETGAVWWGDRILTLFARSVLEERPGSIVIAEAKCSQTLFDDIELHGGVPLMWKAGHSIIKAKMQETGSPLAGEMSGHFFFADRYYGFDDACYAGARLLEILSRTESPLSTLLADLPQMYSTPELRMPCPDENKFAIVERVAEHFNNEHDVITVDGARVIFQNGWGIVRASNTQPMLVLRFEASTAEDLTLIRDTVEGCVGKILEEEI